MAKSVIEKNNAEDKDEHLEMKHKFRRYRLGVWEVIIPVSSNIDLGYTTIPTLSDMLDFVGSFGLLPRLFLDIYGLAPRQFIIYNLHQLGMSFEGGVSLYLDSRILDSISEHLVGKTMNSTDLIATVVIRLVCLVAVEIIRKMSDRDKEILRDRVKFHFMEQSLRTSLLLDPTTAEDPEVQRKIGNPYFDYDSETWTAFEGITNVLTGLLRTTSQLLLAYTLVQKHSNVVVFLLLCLVQPIIGLSSSDYLWGRTHVAYCVNDAYSKLAALHRLAFTSSFRLDRLSDGVGDYIEKEFKINRQELGDVCSAQPYVQWDARQSITFNSIYSVMNNFSLLFFALKVLVKPAGVTFSSLAILQEAAKSVQRTIYTLTYETKSVAQQLTTVKNAYSIMDIKNKMRNGNVSYPRDDLVGDSTGMELEFRNVSFAYPGTMKDVLKNVSFTLKAGQMVVIVGVNGSGKSSTIKLFNRLYDPTEGEILVDGLPLSTYKLKDIRRAMAILRQDHSPYPVSLRRNVALGRPELEPTEAEVQEAIRAGGAHAFIDKLPDKLDTILDPVKNSSIYFQGDTIDSMKKMVEDMEKTTDVSGGESQRLAASRTFMRLSSGGIRFLAADEPTSALDPEGEYELFTRLREQRGGKTVVFITHRFGHLTKHADLILCMKDGCLVEQGTHIELLEKEGEYFRLHQIQAQAFLPSE